MDIYTRDRRKYVHEKLTDMTVTIPVTSDDNGTIVQCDAIRRLDACRCPFKAKYEGLDGKNYCGVHIRSIGKKKEVSIPILSPSANTPRLGVWFDHDVSFSFQ